MNKNKENRLLNKIFNTSKKIFINYKKSIKWFFVFGIMVIITLCLIFDNDFTWYKFFILNGAVLIFTILAYINELLLKK